MKIFNTLTREKQELIPIKEGEVKIYACGPTVYNYIHIGNARPLCVFDVLRRYLKFRGMKVTYVQNFTDVDDKLIKKANEEGITVIIISHDMHLMLEYTPRAVVFHDGRIVADKSAAQVLNAPDIVEQANLKETSLYHLALECGIDDPEAFTRRFIAEDQEVRAR